MSEPFSLEPHLPDDPLMQQAWVDCLRWAIHDPGILASFLAHTGMTLAPLHSLLDRMVDQATGADQAIVEAFLRWFNAYIWAQDTTP